MAYNWFVLDLYSISITLVLILFTHWKGADKSYIHGNRFTFLLGVLILLLIADIFGRGNNMHAHIPFFVRSLSKFASFAFDPLLYYLAYAYMEMWIVKRNRIAQAFHSCVVFFVILNLAAVIFSHILRLGWFYYFDDTSFYHRGPLYIPRAVILSLIFFGAEVIVLLHLKNIAKQHRIPLLIYPLIPTVMGAIQAYAYGMALTYTGIVFSSLIVFLYIQLQGINYDYLTNTLNRKMLDSILENRIRNASPGHSFSSVMIDLDFFKEINDKHGHGMGDTALIDMAELLSKSFRKSDTIARYGGDEFFVVTDIDKLGQLEVAIGRLRRNIESFNAENKRPFRLQASIGYKIYDPEERMSMEDYLKTLDWLMYTEKQKHHGGR